MHMNFLIGIATMAFCLVLQVVPLVLALRYYGRREALIENASFRSSLVVVFGVMTILLIGNLAQLTAWAVVFVLLGEFEHLHDAIYHSAVNFATLGYGDIVMSEKHRLLGPLEAINGVLMIGVSTAALMWIFQDVIRKTTQARRSSR